MAITSYGYPGSIDSVAWAKLTEELGVGYSVKDAADFAPTVVAGVDRTVSVAAGTAFGRGVMDVSTAAIQVQFDIVSSGTRYDLLCIRRNWTGGSSTVTKVTGTSVAAVPAGRNANPGVLDDQPLFLVKLTAGSTVPVIEADLREWGSKVRFVKDLRALVDPKYGDAADVNGVRYRRLLDASSNPIWAPDAPTWTNYTPTLTATGSAPAMDTANRLGRWRKVGDVYEVEARFTWQRLGSGEGLGTGDYYFGLPVAASSWYLHDQVLGSGSYVDVGVATYGECNAVLVEDGGSRLYFAYHGNKVGASYPVGTATNGDVYSFRVSYQGAS